MSSDEDSELAEIRRARAARLGAAGLTISSLRNQLAPRVGRQGEDDEDEDDGPQIVEDDALRGMLPTSFGAAAQADHQDQQAWRPAPPEEELAKSAARPAGGPAAAQRSGDGSGEEDVVGPPRPPEPDGNDAADDQQEGPGEADEVDDPYKLPIAHEVTLESQGKVVSALDVDHSGSRVLSGSYDYTLRIFDFNGMKADLRAFRSLEPSEGHPVMAVSWSPTGDAFLVVTGSPQPKVYTRDGKEEGEFVRGDMYIRDMKNTKGHVSGCTGGMWHPTDKGTAITCSDDGTLRLWDMWELQQRTVIKPQLARPGRVAVTACAFSTDGRIIAGGLMDGTLQLWDAKGQGGSGQFGRSAAVGVVLPPKPQMKLQQKWSYVSGAAQILRNAHAAGNEITSLAFSRDACTLLSRGADETLKVWDVRKLKAPLATFEDLPNAFSTTQCCFSPGEDVFVTALSAPKGGASAGGLAFFDRQRLQLVRRVGTHGSAVAVQWHPAINQILVGCGDRKSGAVRVLYDPALSTRGAMLSVRRAPRAANPFDFQAPPVIYNPNALPLYRDKWPGGRKRKAEYEAELAAQALRTRKPDLGQTVVSGKGAGGKLGTSGGTLLTQYLLKNKGALHNPLDEDVRASILRHAGKEGEFSAFTAAYRATQPERIYAQEEPEEGEEDEEEGAGPSGAH